MGLGNQGGGGNSGNKRSNHNFEHRELLILGEQLARLQLLATETTLISVLNAVIASDQDIEVLLVRDTGNADQVVSQVTNWQTGVPVVTYTDVNGAAYTPTGPLEYLDPSGVLNLILTETLAQGLTLDSIDTSLRTQTRTAGLIRPTGAGTISAGTYSVAIANVGAVDGFFLGVTLKVNETINFDAGALNNTLGAMAYDASGTEFLITTIS
jgi:hypothetical protein